MKQVRLGRIIVISGPSGVGKTTLYREVLPKFEGKIVFSVSATTRPLRQGEVEGKDYYFLTEEEFRRKIEDNEFVEWANVHGCYYGTLRSEVERIINSGNSCLMDIDVQGAMSIRKTLPESVFIFILPPSLEVLKERLKKRNTDSEEVLAIRIQNAEKEMSYSDQYDYKIVNEDRKLAAKELERLLDSLLG